MLQEVTYKNVQINFKQEWSINHGASGELTAFQSNIFNHEYFQVVMQGLSSQHMRVKEQILIKPFKILKVF